MMITLQNVRQLETFIGMDLALIYKTSKILETDPPAIFPTTVPLILIEGRWRAIHFQASNSLCLWHIPWKREAWLTIQPNKKPHNKGQIRDPCWRGIWKTFDCILNLFAYTTLERDNFFQSDNKHT